MTKKQALVVGLGVLVCVLLGVLVGLVLPPLLGLGTGRAALNTATILQRVRTLNQLVTVEYNLEKVQVWDGELKVLHKVIPIPLGQDRIILLAHGTVKAGVDLAKLRPEDIRVSGKNITLTLPPAEITDAYLKESETKVLDRQTGLFTRFDRELEQTARRSAVTAMRDSARASEIKPEAERRARTALTDFLKALGFEKIDIRTREN